MSTLYDDSNVLTKLTEDTLNQLTNTDQLAQPWPAPILNATFKSSPADFKVDEIMDIELSGEGEHLWLHIQKTGLNTAYIAEQLAKWANIPKRDVGYSGMKDRQAVTSQWFSLRLPKKQLPEQRFEDYVDTNMQSNGATHLETTEAIKVLKRTWHSKKLNRGTHRANRFAITLRDVQLDSSVASNQKEADKILASITKLGVPNYFGSQRFGRNGHNIAQALEWFEQGTINGRRPKSKKDHDLQSILLSAARSAIFNQILDTRVKTKSWNTGLDGEVFNLEGTGSVFASSLMDDVLKQRVANGDIHPTAPLWGINNDKVVGTAKTIEETTIDSNVILKMLANGLENKKVKTMRRSLRLPITDFRGCWIDSSTLELTFSLPTGAFATSVLASIIYKLHG